ncbi:hypothetical protein V3C99_006978 [Haemonchus contortus]
MDALPAVLQAVQKQLDLQGAAIMQLMEKMSTSPTCSVPVVMKDKHTIFDSLHRRIEKFIYDPDRGRTFDIWLRRYQDLFDNECDDLEEKDKTRLLVSRLDEDCHQMLTAAIAPKQPSELSWNEVLEVLERQFGSAKTLFRRRFECFKMRYEGQEFNNYELLVKTKCTDAKLDIIDFDGLQCLLYVAGFQGPDFADYRTRLLRKLDQSEKVTLKDLTAKCQLIKSYKEDSRMLEGVSSAVNFIRHKKRFRSKKKSKSRERQKKELNELHSSEWKPQSGPTTSRRRHRHINNVIAALKRDDHPHLDVAINGHPAQLLLDTGSEITIISESTWKLLGSPQLQSTDVTGYVANGTPLKIRGYFETDFTVANSSGGRFNGHGTCFVTEDNCNVFGMPWIKQLPDLYRAVRRYQVHRTIVVDHVATSRDATVAKLKAMFPDVFKSGLGRCTTTKATLKLRTDALPVFKKKRPVPYANVEVLDKEINRLLAEDVLSPVTYSKWAAPIVVVKKANGTLRLCADYSTGLNDALMLHQHPLPTPEDVFAKLNGGTIFTQIDFADAYLQVEVDEASKGLLTINTHRGLFRYNRLPFGVKSAPGIFQQIMDSMTAGLEGCAAYLDDVIVTGRTIEEHAANLEALFERINQFGFHVRMEKCSFLMHQIRYLGNIIDADGRRPDPGKVEVIKKMPPPQDIQQVRSFLGLLNYYGAFVEEMHQLRAPLDKLLKKDAHFNWSPECQRAFDRAKEILSSDLLLTHYDPSKEIVVAADASEYGIGAVISHRFSNGSEKPIYHACRTLTAAERNYGQVEKEGLALVFAVRKFHRYLHGRHFKLLTDHKPLLAIFGNKKGIPVYTANRLQRWSLLMLNYNFTIEHRTSNNFGQADALSRLIAEQTTPPEDVIMAKINVDAINLFMDASTKLPVTADAVAEETLKDIQLKEVLQCVQTGRWPKKPKDELLRFNSMRNTLTTHRGCLLFGDRIVIPKKLQAAVLTDLHDGHPGMSRMKMLAREYCYWINIDKDIEEKVKSCNRCQEVAKSPVKTTLCPWPIEDRPWNRVHADFAGPVDGRMFLVVVDAFSKWPEIVEMSTTSSPATIKELRQLFSQFGYPETLVTDNGTQFTSREFSDFCHRNGIKHLRSPPFHPQSNGQAERFVDTFKRTLYKLRGEGTVQEALQTFLFNYRRTPCPTLSGRSPAEVFLGRRLRSTLTVLQPREASLEHRRNPKMEAQFNRHHGAHQRTFKPDDIVWTRDYRAGYPRWIKGRVRFRHGQCIYDVQVDDQLWRRQANQLRPGSDTALTTLNDQFDLPLLPCNTNDTPTRDQRAGTNEDSSPTPSAVVPAASPRRSRSRRPPVRLQVNPKKKTYTDGIRLGREVLDP